jgi:hypothetical protein
MHSTEDCYVVPTAPVGSFRVLQGLTPRVDFAGASAWNGRAFARIRRGDIVRVELAHEQIWVYCKVQREADHDHVLCTLVETQSWPNLALVGGVPGKRYLIARSDVLSVVEPWKVEGA